MTEDDRDDIFKVSGSKGDTVSEVVEAGDVGNKAHIVTIVS